MSKKPLSLWMLVVVVLFAVGCTREPSKQVTELQHFRVDSMEGIITQSGVQIDKEISSDGNGSR